MLRVTGVALPFPAGRGAAVATLRETVVPPMLAHSLPGAAGAPLYSVGWGEEFYKSNFGTRGGAAIAFPVAAVCWLPPRGTTERPRSRRVRDG